MSGTDLFVILFGAPLLLLAISIPLILLQAVFRGGPRLFGWVIRRRNIPLGQRNQTRAGIGAFLLALSAAVAATGLPFVHPIGVWLVAGVAAFGLLYLCVGIHGSQGARFDVISALGWCVIGLGCAALLVFKGFPV
jgi:hypothetical protein